MKLTAIKVAWSSMVGQTILLQDETRSVVCQLSIHNVRSDLDPKTTAGEIASLICDYFKR